MPRDSLELVPGRRVGPGLPCFFICEGGINHNGDLELAKKIIHEAKAVGADAVKFQKRVKEAVLTNAALLADYNSVNAFGKTYGEHRDFLEFSFDQWMELKQCAAEVNIPLTGSAWDEQSVDFLDAVGVPFFKVASADLLNFPLLAYTASKGKPLVLSTGMATMEQVFKAVQFISQQTDDFVLLHCTSTYPASPESCNLRVISSYLDAFPNTIIGYSGHENGVAISEAAVVLGACVVERHFTLDRTLKGGDHAASLEPRGFKELVDRVRKIETALGDGKKRLMNGEEAVKKKLAKSAVAKCLIPAKTCICDHHLCYKSPGDGVPASDVKERLIGKIAKQDIDEDTVVYESLVE